MVKTGQAAVQVPVLARGEPFPGSWPGAWMIGEEEFQAVMEVMRAKSPFRHYGPQVLQKARAFEKAFASRMGTPYTLGVTSGTAALYPQ